MTALQGGVLGPADRNAYAALIESHPYALVYHTLDYLAAIASIVDSEGPTIYGAWRNGQLVAAMPGFLSACDLGTVYNAGPYYGSHGDVLLAEGEDEAAMDASLMRWNGISRMWTRSISLPIRSPRKLRGSPRSSG